MQNFDKNELVSTLLQYYDDFNEYELSRINSNLKKKIKTEKTNNKKVKKRKKRGTYNVCKTIEFFNDCLVIKIGTRNRRKNNE